MTQRIFTFGLDGATWKIIDGLIKKGQLPFLKKIISQGVKKDLYSTIPPRTAPAWTSFITSQTPGEHGVSDFIVKKNVFGAKKEVLASGNLIGDQRFWRDWERRGKRIALVNLPMTYPVKKINGITVSSILTPKNKPWYYPKNLVKNLQEADYHLKDFDFLRQIYLSKLTSREKLSTLERMVDSKFRLVFGLIEKEDWDFLFLLFSETDWVQHLFWRGRQTQKIYQKIDGYLSQIYRLLVKKYGARNFSFLVISDHGFHPAPKLYFNIYPWLRKKGFLKLSAKPFLARVLRKASFWQKDKNESNFRSWGEQKLLKIEPFGIWLNSKVLKSDYHHFRDRLVSLLKNLKYQNGKKVFKLVGKREEIYQGKKVKHFCDIVWLTNPFFAVGQCSIEKDFFTPRLVGVKAIHDSDRKGIFLAKGVGIKKNLNRWHNKDIYIWQMANIFDKIFGHRREAKKSKLKTKQGKKRDLSAEKEVYQRLKSLGYV